MFISRQAYTDLRFDCLTAQANHQASIAQVAQLTAHVEWLQVRLTQVEFERAGLIKRYMGIDMPVPTFEPAPTHTNPDPNQTMDFSDVGDEEAAKMGIEWNHDGTLKYSKK